MVAFWGIINQMMITNHQHLKTSFNFKNHQKRVFQPLRERKMLQTLSVSKTNVENLPEDVLRLISMGRYTLYKATSPSDHRVSYVLRVSAKDLFVLTNNGSPIEFNDFSDIQITGKVKIEDISSPFVVSNFSFN
jgi:hypothetical protein